VAFNVEGEGSATNTVALFKPEKKPERNGGISREWRLI
jgi:hypothetical protein